MKLEKNINKKDLYEIIVIFIVYLVIGRLLIHSGDDWAWGGEIGMERLRNGFDNYNGRYIGNLVEMLITRNMIMRLIIYSLVNTGIIFLLYELLNRKFEPRYFFLIMLLIPIDIYKQTYGWLAGFANYNISTFFILLIFYLVQKGKDNYLSFILILITSFISQFFVENFSIANVFLAIVGLTIALVCKKRIKLYLAWLFSSVAGLLIMFSNTAYHAQDNMRGLSNINLSNFIKFLLTSWTELFVKNNALLLLFFAICIYLINNKKGFLSTVPLMIATYFLIRKTLDISYNLQPTLILWIEFILIIIFLIILIITVGNAAQIKIGSKIVFYFYLFASVILLAPFLILTPFGPRNILTSYVLLVLCLFELLKYLEIDIIPSKKIIGSLVLILSFFFISLHAINKIEENKRIHQMKTDVESGLKEIEFSKLPYEFLGHDLTPLDGSVQSNRQKTYHGVSQDIKFNIVGYKPR